MRSDHVMQGKQTQLQKGFVRPVPNKGHYVAELSRREAGELFEVQEALAAVSSGAQDMAQAAAQLLQGVQEDGAGP